jgi:1-aminocyclopropane-1-carboxylate deaminase
MNLFNDADNFAVNIELLNNPLFSKHKVTVSMLRLDAIHPVVSGNKIFKLHYFLEDALNSGHKKIITFGGPYSNHLAATAYACNAKGIKSIGIVRGENSTRLSHTLLFCTENGMQLEFVSRSVYQNKNRAEFENMLLEKYGNHLLIPEGGFSPKGAHGAKLITNHYKGKGFTHICCAIGTATTFAGLIMGEEDNTRVTGVSILKNLNDIDARLNELKVTAGKQYRYNNDYHFGGYAKKTAGLIDFMNTFYKDNNIPLDFVYTGKMMFGVFDLINKNYFPAGSNVLCIHTGGLQGNQSLPEGLLNF